MKELKDIQNVSEIYGGLSEGEFKKYGYDLSGLSEEDRKKQLEEVLALHEHLSEIEKKDTLDFIPSDELEGLKLPEEIRSPEEQELYEKCRAVARNILDMFDLNPKKEDLLIITDAGVIKRAPQIIEAVIERAKEVMKNNFRVMVAPEVQKSATPLGEAIGDIMPGRPILLINSISRSHSPETAAAWHFDRVWLKKAQEDWERIIQSEKLREVVIRGYSSITPERLEELRSQGWGDSDLEKMKSLAKERRARVVSVTRGTNIEALTTGAAQESIETLFEKTEKLKEIMRDVEYVDIVSPEGTNLRLYPRVEYTVIDNGKINKPGMGANFPNGEWSSAVKLEGTSGTLVVNGPCGEGIDRHLVGKGIKLEIKDGLITHIEGVTESEGLEIFNRLVGTDEQVKSLKQTLEQGNLDGKFNAITNPELPKIWANLPLEEQEKIKSYLVAQRLKISLERGNELYKPKHPKDEKANAFKLAELGIGVNTKALRPSISLTAEKEYGTIHIAAGRNAVFDVPEQDVDFNAVDIHCDMIISGLTIKGKKNDGKEFILMKDGRPIDY